MTSALCLIVAATLGAKEVGWQPLEGQQQGIEYYVCFDADATPGLAKQPDVHNIPKAVTDIRRIWLLSGDYELPNKTVPESTQPGVASTNDTVEIYIDSAKQLENGFMYEVPQELRGATKVSVFVGKKPVEVPAASAAVTPLPPETEPIRSMVPAGQSTASMAVTPDRVNSSGSTTNSENEPTAAASKQSNVFEDRYGAEMSRRPTESGEMVRSAWNSGSALSANNPTAPQSNEPRNEPEFTAGPSEKNSELRSDDQNQDPEAEAEGRPWLPLTLSLLALFASLGSNVYLGYLNWESRTRYQRLLARMQSDSKTDR